MAFITKYKLRSTLKRIKGKNISDPIKQLLKDRLFFLSKENLEYIGVFILFIKDSYKFIKTYKIEWKDTFTFIVEKNPAYHYSRDCKLLTSFFDNIYIPKKIKDANLIKELRELAEKNDNLFKNNKEDFIRVCILYFNSQKFNLILSESDFVAIVRPNSGITDYNNATIDEILDAIKKLFIEVNNFYSIEENVMVARNLGNKLYLKNKEELPRPLGLPTEVVRKSLTKIDEFNYIFLEILSEYYMKMFNPEMEFKENILDVLNFKCCTKCIAIFDESPFFDGLANNSIRLNPNYHVARKTEVFTIKSDYQEVEELLTF